MHALPVPVAVCDSGSRDAGRQSSAHLLCWAWRETCSALLPQPLTFLNVGDTKPHSLHRSTHPSHPLHFTAGSQPRWVCPLMQPWCGSTTALLGRSSPSRPMRRQLAAALLLRRLGAAEAAAAAVYGGVGVAPQL
jgi:hypothetical protein